MNVLHTFSIGKRPEMPAGLVDMQVNYHVYQYGGKALEPEVHIIKLYLSDTVEFTIMHIKRSLGFSGRLTINGSYAAASKSKNKLREYLQSGTQKIILELESVRTRKKNCFPTPLTVVIDSKTTIQQQLSVQHTTTLQEVQHQIQNEYGVPIKEQQLFVVAKDSSKTPTRLTDRVVNFYKHGFKGLQLVLPRRHALGIM